MLTFKAGRYLGVLFFLCATVHFVSELHAVVNNAGVMTIGNFEWQTPSMIADTININLLGAMRVTSAFLPSLRKSALEVN